MLFPASLPINMPDLTRSPWRQLKMRGAKFVCHRRDPDLLLLAGRGKPIWAPPIPESVRNKQGWMGDQQRATESIWENVVLFCFRQGLFLMWCLCVCVCVCVGVCVSILICVIFRLCVILISISYSPTITPKSFPCNHFLYVGYRCVCRVYSLYTACASVPYIYKVVCIAYTHDTQIFWFIFIQNISKYFFYVICLYWGRIAVKGILHRWRF